jgi:hypothetical protein
VLDALDPAAGWGSSAERLARRYLRDWIDPQVATSPDSAGGFAIAGDTPRVVRAASRCEALAAVALARPEFGRWVAPRLGALADHVARNVRTREATFWLDEAQAQDGAVRLGLLDETVRLDANKHALRCLCRTELLGAPSKLLRHPRQSAP